MPPLLKITDLVVNVNDASSSRALLKNVHLDVGQEETVALVGASGGGKTSLGLSILRLLPAAMEIKQGSIFFKEENLLTLSLSQMRHIRGKEIGMIFQESLSAFNPVFTIGEQVAEVVQTHRHCSKAKARKEAETFLDLVEIDDVYRVARAYPHQLSGGLRQRAMIAQAIAAGPSLVIADEPTSNLDVTIQAKILELFKKLKIQQHFSFLLITHDLGIVRFMADRLFVLHDGQVVEQGDSEAVLKAPQHVFTQQLLRATQ